MFHSGHHVILDVISDVCDISPELVLGPVGCSPVLLLLIWCLRGRFSTLPKSQQQHYNLRRQKLFANFRICFRYIFSFIVFFSKNILINAKIWSTITIIRVCLLSSEVVRFSWCFVNILFIWRSHLTVFVWKHFESLQCSSSLAAKNDRWHWILQVNLDRIHRTDYMDAKSHSVRDQTKVFMHYVQILEAC